MMNEFVTVFNCSCLLVPEPPVVWNNVSRCFLLDPHVHLAQGKLSGWLRQIVCHVKRKNLINPLCTFVSESVGGCFDLD